MSVWNVFDSDAFSLNSLTAAINKVPYTPGVIGGMGLFSEQGISTTTAVIEEENGVLTLVDVAPRNGVAQVVGDRKRAVRSFPIPHMPERATIMADEVQGVRAFGSESNATSVEIKRNQRLADMRRNLDYTLEQHRLKAIMGNYVDVNGTDQSLTTAFGVSGAVDEAFKLSTESGKVRGKCLKVIKKIEDGLGGVPFTDVVALCGATFWEELLDTDSLKGVVQGYQAAQSLREDPRLEVVYGGIRFIRYRGTSSVKVADNDAYAFPAGVPDLFITRFAPANYLETVNTLGLPVYAKAEPLPMDKGIQIEAQSNALNLCTRPNAVVKLLKGAS